jgi:hypothetical protein
MYNSLTCAVKGTVTPSNYGTLFATVCGLGGGSACAGIKTDPLNGVYGAYSMCNSTEQLSFALDQYYKSQQNAATACNFQGAAGIKNAIAAPSACAALMAQAGPQGTGTVTTNPIGAAAGSGSGSSSSSGAAKKSAGTQTAPNMQLYGMFAWLAVLGLAGAGIILI